MSRRALGFGAVLFILILVSAVILFFGEGGPVSGGKAGDNDDASGADSTVEAREKTVEELRSLARDVSANELGYIPILVYHQIGAKEGRWTRTPDNFRKDLEELYARDYVLISLTDYLTGNIDIPAGKSPVVITFDDSTPGHFRLLNNNGKLEVDPDCAVGILRNFGQKHPGFGHVATFFVNAYPFGGEEGQAKYWQQKLKMLAEWGFEIGNHTYHHQNLGTLTPDEVQMEIATLQEHIAQAVPGYRPTAFAIVQDGVPEPFESVIEGTYKDVEYHHQGVVMWAWRDAYSPFHRDFNPYRVQRIQVFQDHGESSLSRWLDRLEPRRYVSDGDIETVAIPHGWEEALPDEYGYTVVVYERDDPGPTPAKENQALNAKGVHVTFSYASSAERWNKILQLIDKTQLNAVQLDVKDESGRIGYLSQVQLAQEIGAAKDMIPIRETLAGLRDRGIYSIARIVIFRDPVLAKQRPQYMVKTPDGRPLHGGVWVNPYSRDVWDYNIALAKEAYELGFDEVQFDYIRFPEGRSAWTANYVGKDDRGRVDVIAGFLKYAREQIGWEKPLSVAVFGFIGFAQDDMRIGQRPERMAPYCDYMSPMVYPSHYSRGNYGFANPNAHPYEVVASSLKDFERLLENSGCRLRPWLQAFTLGSPPYGRNEIQAQIRATEDQGKRTWLLWNAGVFYRPEDIVP
ncbi:MAG: polysaccharide deacetylase family protein [Peptococcaceae bacterium]|nr:polysaccharide deacetylase family protein [Peptococcaceae bacterium]